MNTSHPGARTRKVCSFAALALLLATAAIAGPLTPPVGPVAPTGKTTQEVFDKVAAAEPRIAISATNTPGDNDASPSLFKITAPGSYYLTGNITGVSGKHGIEITSGGVTIDLNGFELNGVAGSLDGISATVNFLTSITIQNGSVRNWRGDGIDLSSSFGVNCTARNVKAVQNSGNGIFVANGNAIIECNAHLNNLAGIRTGGGCIISSCHASFNIEAGISAGIGNTVSGCTVLNNSTHGILAASNCTITACTAYGNSQTGFTLGNGCTISGCTAASSGTHGILVGAQCLVTGNTSANNGVNVADGAGILVTVSDNRIEGNNCTSSDRGISVDVAGNIITRNTCSGNTTNWVIAANNVYGPIIDRTAPASAAVNGNAAVSTLGSTDPNANFTY